MNKFILLGQLILLTNCASWKAGYKFCKDANWREIGMRNAKNDKKMEETFQTYKVTCSEFDDDMQADLTLYRFGHYSAIKTLCTYDRGNEFGLDRKNTSNNCSRAKHQEFYRGMQDGIDQYCSFERHFISCDANEPSNNHSNIVAQKS